MTRLLPLLVFIGIALSLSGCGSDTKFSQESCTGPADVLLYNGQGADESSWIMLNRLVNQAGHCTHVVDAAALNALTVEEITKHRLIVFPGGYGDTQTYGLKRSTRLRIRSAVRKHGLGFLGVCAGAWIAVGAEADTSRVANYGLAVAKGPHLKLYLPEGPRRLAAIVGLTFPDGRSRSTVWWGSPSTPEWENGVVARYSTGEPAISQTRAGKGFVVVSGPHPEADYDWYTDSGEDPDGLDHDLTISLIDAAYRKQPLPTFTGGRYSGLIQPGSSDLSDEEKRLWPTSEHTPDNPRPRENSGETLDHRTR